jgi:hypothetical protein
MDPLSFDGYTTYSDNSSAPRTPSPTTVDFTPNVFPDSPSLLQDLYEHNEWHPHMVRRATFPYVRHDEQQQYYYDPAAIKLEDPSPVMVPTQSPTTYYYPMVPTSNSYLSHTGIAVQHTDDAASKETQYLRRRCFNCHTTEPPSWRRSTLNPGKIVCNKCGLYERTHLRPRPLRFDELRAGNKARKHAKAPSPKVKKEPAAPPPLLRRASISSNNSSGANSDWDDNVSVYSSSGSAPPTSFNSPQISSFPLSRDSQSPPAVDLGIRLPNNPLAELSQHSPPRKSHSMPFHQSVQTWNHHIPQQIDLHEDLMVTPSSILDEKHGLVEEIGVGA